MRSLLCVVTLLYLIFSRFPMGYAVPSSHSSKPVAARVNGEMILLEDLKKDSGVDENLKVLLDRKILFELAVQEAKANDLDKSPEYVQEAKKLLYRNYLNSISKSATQTMKITPSFSEVENFYLERPLVRIRHLLLFARNPREKRRAEETLAKLHQRLEEGTPFKSLVLEYSEDSSVERGGDSDLRGFHQMPDALYSVAKKLDTNAVSDPIRSEGLIHVIQLLDKKDYADIPASYRELLRHRLIQEKETALLTKTLAHLRSKARIEIIAKELK